MHIVYKYICAEINPYIWFVDKTYTAMAVVGATALNILGTTKFASLPTVVHCVIVSKFLHKSS